MNRARAVTVSYFTGTAILRKQYKSGMASRPVFPSNARRPSLISSCPEQVSHVLSYCPHLLAWLPVCHLMNVHQGEDAFLYPFGRCGTDFGTDNSAIARRNLAQENDLTSVFRRDDELTYTTRSFTTPVDLDTVRKEICF